MQQNPYYRYNDDQRDPETIKKQASCVNYHVDRNKLIFEQYIKEELAQVDAAGQQNQEKIVIKRMDLDGGRFVEYRDNKTESSKFELENKTIIFIQGVPGGIKYYGRIESVIGNTFCRMINFYTPGFDKKDERRGIYQGSLDDLVQLIEDFMEQLKIEKAIFVMHSVGGMITKCFAQVHPQRVEGLVQIATIPVTKWNGIKMYEGVDKKFYQIDDTITKETFFDEGYRSKLFDIHEKNRSETSKLPQEEQELLGPIIQFSFLDTVNFMKLRISVPGKVYEILHRMRQVNKTIPRMFVYSLKDQLMQHYLQEEEIYLFVVGENAVKRRVTKQVNDKIKLNTSNFCSNYLFRYDDSTHSVHHEKGREIGVLLKHFVRQLQFTEIIDETAKL